MKSQLLYNLMLFLFVIGLFACGSTDDEEIDSLTKPTPENQTTPPTSDEVAKVPEVDYAAEEAAIRELFTLNAENISNHDLKGTMALWVRKDTPDVFMAQCFVGEALFNIIEGANGVQNSLKGDFANKRSPLEVTIATVGIDKRGKKATLRGEYKWGPFANGQLVAAFEKDTKDNWRIRAIDFCDKDLIKELETPKAE